MYTHCTLESLKDSILKNFKSVTTVVATIAFNLGVDCPNVHQTIHWGVPEYMETFTHETGRSGRDGQPSCSLLPVERDKQKAYFFSVVSHLFQNSRSYTNIQDGFKMASVASRLDNTFQIVQVPVLYGLKFNSNLDQVSFEVQCYFHSRLNLCIQVYPCYTSSPCSYC